MATITGISGSIRRASLNAGLLRAAGALTPDGIAFRIASIEGIPLYDADVEASRGLPPSVVALKDAIAAADGVILATPEYNNGVPGVLKNAIDWASRPSSDIGRVFGGRPVAVIGASPGGFGTVLAQNAWLPVLRALGARPWTGGRLMVSRASGLFDGDGELTDEATREKVRDFVAGFAASL